MQKVRSREKAQNLKNVDPHLYRLIDTYNINQQYLAEKVFDAEWKEAADDESVKRKLVGRLRNKLLGFGRLLPAEYTKLQHALSEIANDMSLTVDESMARSNEDRKEKIRRLLEGIDDESLDDLLSSN